MPAAMLSDEIAIANELLANAAPQEVLAWAVKRFHPKLLMATAFGAEGCCLIDMLSRIEPGVTLINLDTGYQFPETLDVRERIRQKYGIEVELVRPATTISEYEKAHGLPVHQTNPTQCCHDRKIVPLRAALERHTPLAWISAIRKDQTEDRGVADVVQWDKKFGLVKVNPLLRWTKREVWAHIAKHDVPYNDLHDRGYPSVGCWPCTKAVLPGHDERSGRWAGTAKKECGLHIDEKEGSGI
ncbi:MAG: phosphoadenylyl-sulfate reductase [Fimbriiglobus sp.]|jgi:phosphoadenosine phosphosulfate reductase|nr:phosphoadenylyl-sulfate reductase [Fimbriiglobus sp.]